MPFAMARTKSVTRGDDRRDPAVARARKLANVMDRFGYVDPLLGLVMPGIGDVAGGAIGLYVIAVALQKRVHPVIIARMLINLAVDTLIGMIPLAGDVFDFFHKAHVKNVRLLEERHIARRATAGDWAFVTAAVVLFLLALVLPFILALWVLAAIF
jgi:hypothetical protein